MSQLILEQQVVTCLSRIDETPDSATFVLESPEAFKDYLPGQFLLITLTIEGKEQQRAYSLSSSPSRPSHLAITVKRVTGGVVSNYMLDHLNQGDRIQISQPAGEFYLPVDKLNQHRRFLLLSAGSGITPVMSMGRYLLDTQAEVDIHFIHCARSKADLIFAQELEQLDSAYSNFKLHLVFLDVEEVGHPFGLLTPELLQALAPELEQTQVYTCGPQPFMELVKTSLQARAFDLTHYHQESFTGAQQEMASNPSAHFQVEVPAFGKSLEATENSGLLETLEQGGIPIIGACRSGVCGSCKCKVIQGEVETTSQMGLTAEEIEAGYVLACSSKVKSDLAVELS